MSEDSQLEFVSWARGWPDPACVLRDDGAIEWANPAFQRCWPGARRLGELRVVTRGDTATSDYVTSCRRSDGSEAAYAWRLSRSTDFTLAVSLDVTSLHDGLRVEPEQHERFGLAVEGANCGLWDWDIRTGHVARSPFVKQILGFDSGDELPDLYDSIEVRLHPSDHERVQRAVAAHLHEFEPYDIEYRLRTKDGSYRWFRARGEALRNADGEPFRMTGSIIDIDAHKRVERDLEQAREAAEAANESKSAFLANMSHEIRTPMNGHPRATPSCCWISTMSTENTRSMVDHLIARSRRNGGHLISLIDDILDLSKIEATPTRTQSSTIECSRPLLRSGGDVAAARARREA